MKALVAAEPPAEYLAPEQIRQAPVTDKADVYAFATILYEMLCGVPPFRAATREAVLQKHLTEAPVPMRRRRRAVPVEVESVVALALDKQPESRPFMPDFLNSLVAEAHRPTPRWNRTAVIVRGAAVAASVALLMVWGPLVLRSLASRPPVQPAQPSAIAEAPASVPSPSSETYGSASAAPARELAFTVQAALQGSRSWPICSGRKLPENELKTPSDCRGVDQPLDIPAVEVRPPISHSSARGEALLSDCTKERASMDAKFR